MFPSQCTVLLALALSRGAQSRVLGERKPAAKWRSWRYGESNSFLQLRDDGPPERTYGLEYLGISLEKLRSCSKSALQRPNSDQIGEEIEDTRLSVKLVKEAAHIYLLCVECAKVPVPSTWASKITLVNGHLSDKCLGITHSHHYVKATTAHKLLLADAKANNYSDAFVLEEDWVDLKDDRINAGEVEQFYTQGDWQLFRPAFHANIQWYKIHKFFRDCGEACTCKMQQGSKDLCTLPARCDRMGSSVAYAVKHRSIDRLLEQVGNIDQAVLNSMPSTLVLPPIFYQRDWIKYALKNDDIYVQRCLGREPLPPLKNEELVVSEAMKVPRVFAPGAAAEPSNASWTPKNASQERKASPRATPTKGAREDTEVTGITEILDETGKIPFKNLKRVAKELGAPMTDK